MINERKDNIYVYLWDEFNTIYIGRTINPKSRHQAHKTRATEATYKFSSEHHVEHPKMIIIENDLTIEEGIEREKYWINEYRENSPYEVLNKTKGGETGTPDSIKWTKENVFNEGKKYEYRSDFYRKSPGAYHVALSNNWLDEIFSEKRKPIPIYKWTKEAVFEESKKYDTRYHFQNGNESAYKKALDNNWLDEMTWLKKVGHFIKWDEKSTFEESKKYITRNNFRHGSPGAYYAALSNNWLDKMEWLKPDIIWTKEAVFEESKKHKTKTEFKRGNDWAYRLAIKNGWINEMNWLKPYSKYTKEDVFEESKKYDSRNQFKHNSSMYQIALKHKWLDEMTWLKPKLNKKTNI